MPHATVTVDFAKPIGTVSPRLYGHFAEHLGRCCYYGLWVGRDSEIPNTGGFRTDVVDALSRMPTPLLRWPGGCYADRYHWRDGIGEDRPARLGLSCGRRVEEDNGLGTHEFLALCEAIGAEPYLAGNMGSGSVQEICDWIEYTTYGGNTALAKEREANGRKEPWNIALWGVGNENWGCGGHYSPESYSLEYRRYATMIRDTHGGAIEMVFCGQEKDWNERSVETMKGHVGLLKHFSIHRYWLKGGLGAEFSEEEFDAVIQEAHETEEFVLETRKILDRIDPDRKIGIALDEWGMWHGDARSWGQGGTEGYCDDYTQPGTLRDALAAAVALEGFHRQCNVLSLCNLAQIVNVLHAPIMTDGPAMWLTPTYHLLRMHTPHVGGEALTTASDNAKVSATATRRDGKTTISVVNRSYRDANSVLIEGLKGEVTAELLHAAPEAQNSAAQPNRVAPKPIEVKVDDEGIWLPLPPHSFATMAIS